VKVQRHGGSVETKRFLGDWAALAPSLADSKDAAAAARELIKIDMPGGITQLRGVYPAGTERYGEEYSINAGSTDNSYLLKPSGDQPFVLVGVHDGVFAEEFIETLGKEALDKLGHLVLQFFDGKQVDTIQGLIKGRAADLPPLKIHCSSPIVKALKNKLSEVEGRYEIIEITNESTLEIEEGRALKFVLTPTPKTPEGLVAFDPATGALFSGKFFSAHRSVTSSCSGFDAPGAEGWEEYSSDWFHLFDCYFFTENAQDAIRELFRLAEALHGPDVTELAPMHGPVVRDQCWKLMAKYEAWTEQKLRKENRRDSEVLVMYASAYGHTKKLAEAVCDGLKDAGANVNLLNLEWASAKEVQAALETCDGFFVGSPTLGGEMPSQVKEALGVVLSAASSEDTERVPCGVFGSYGWSGEAVDELHFRLKDGGFPFACDPIRVRFRPTVEHLDLCKEAGVRMSQKIQSVVKERIEKRSRDIDPEQANSAAEAFGKMRTSKCVIATKDPKGEDKVTQVSWVNQASFDPPAITVSILKKDLDPFLSLSMDEQLEMLFKRYDVDGGGTLDREEITMMLRELFGVRDDAGAKIVQGKIDDALAILDENNDGSVDIEEIREASTNGPLAALLENQRKLLALEAAIGSDPGDGKKGSGGLPFVLNFLPQDASQEAIDNPTKHKKAKPTNGCLVHADCTAYVECAVTQALNCGDSTLLLARVLNGKVMKDNELTALVSVVESAAAGDSTATDNKPEMAMASSGRKGLGGAVAGAHSSAFAGCTRPSGLTRAANQNAWCQSRAMGTATTRHAAELSEVATWTGLTPGKEYKLQTMTVKDVAKDTTTIRSLDWDRDRFDIEFALERGTTYNSYIIKGAEKTALVDTSHEKFSGLFMDALNKEVDYANLDYLIVSHTEPDHSGLIGEVIARAKAAGNEDLTVVGSKVCIQFLENLLHEPFKSQTVANNVKIDLGGGHELEFLIAPNLHWPDTMFTFDHGTGLLYTCDAFGMHYCSDEVVDVEGVKELLPHYAIYYDCLMKPNARSVLTALKKSAGFDFHTVATGHGPMLKENTQQWIDQYKSWSEKAMENSGPTVAIFWVSNFGESERLSQIFAHGLTSSDITVEMADLNAVDAFEVTESLARSDVVVVMSPPQGENDAQSAISTIVANSKAKKHRFMVLESCGENQEPVDLIGRRFMGAQIPEAMAAMKVQGDFDARAMQGYEEAGMAMGKLLTQKAKLSKSKKQDQEMERALGRLSSSLYVVTAAKNGVEHAMVASWVTPASQSPMGVSLSIAKDRAMEPLLHVGDSFIVNFLEEGKSLDLMKHFLKKFEPGSNRLAGIDSFTGGNGAAVLRDACAYMECRIVSRMDAEDHWLAYAEVTGGNVARSDAEVAVHHRKVGTYY